MRPICRQFFEKQMKGRAILRCRNESKTYSWLVTQSAPGGFGLSCANGQPALKNHVMHPGDDASAAGGSSRCWSCRRVRTRYTTRARRTEARLNAPKPGNKIRRNALVFCVRLRGLGGRRPTSPPRTFA